MNMDRRAYWEDEVLPPSPVDAYLDAYLEYLDGTRPEPPAQDELTGEERAEVQEELELVHAIWGSKKPPDGDVPADDADACVKPDAVLVDAHETDRGWAAWITWALENAGHPVQRNLWQHPWRDVWDNDPTLARSRTARRAILILPGGATLPFGVQWARYTAVLTGMHDSGKQHAMFARVHDEPWPEELRNTNPVELVGHDQDRIWTTLLTELGDDQPPATGSHWSPLNVLARQAGATPHSHLASVDDETLLEELVDQASHLRRLEKRTNYSATQLHAALAEALDSAEFAVAIRFEDLRRYAELAIDLLSLADVACTLGNHDQAHACREQAEMLYAAASGQDHDEVRSRSKRRRKTAPVAADDQTVTPLRTASRC